MPVEYPTTVSKTTASTAPSTTQLDAAKAGKKSAKFSKAHPHHLHTTTGSEKESKAAAPSPEEAADALRKFLLRFGVPVGRRSTARASGREEATANGRIAAGPCIWVWGTSRTCTARASGREEATANGRIAANIFRQARVRARWNVSE
ncbi:MAG: hypothetical protein Q9161_004320 [Pseudevernia consocians]